MHWSMKSVQSCLGTNLQHDVTCVMLRHRRQHEAFSVEVVDEGAFGSLALELRSWSALTGNGVVSCIFVLELGVDPSLTCATFVHSRLFSVTRLSKAANRSVGNIWVLRRTQPVLQVCEQRCMTCKS